MNAVAEQVIDNPELRRRESYNLLMDHRSGDALDVPIAKMLASLAHGFGAMPVQLGLSRSDFIALLRDHYPGVDPSRFWGFGRPLDLERADEGSELHTLFMAHAARPGPDAYRVATILVAGCMADDHLWQDLGLWSRKDLSGLIGGVFPALAAKNDRDMKWKKFLYKQLCIQEGVYTCRAPSCAVCADYAVCFGPED